MPRHVDTLPRVRLPPADWERVEAMAQAERRSVSNMLGVLVAEALATRDADQVDQGIRRFERAQKGASK